MKFKTAYDSERIHAPESSQFKGVYELQTDEDGVPYCVKSGEVCFTDEIQSYAEGCDVRHMIEKYIQGDPSALDRQKGVFADLSAAPNSLMDAQNAINKASNIFDQLPREIRQFYDNNLNKFLQSVDDGSFSRFLKKAQGSPKKPPVDPQKEVKENG